MTLLYEEVVISLMESAKNDKIGENSVFENYSFEPLRESLKPIFERSKVYPELIKIIGEVPFVTKNFDREMKFPRRAAKLTASNIVVLTFLRVREIFTMVDSSHLESNSKHLRIYREKADRIYRRDYHLLEKLLYMEDFLYTTECILMGVIGKIGSYKAGPYEVVISPVSNKSNDLLLANVKREHKLKRDDTLFTEDRKYWEKIEVEEDFLELVAIINLIKPDLGASISQPNLKVDLLTFSDIENRSYAESNWIEGIAISQKTLLETGYELFDISKYSKELNAFWDQVHILGDEERDRIISAMRRFGIAILRKNPNDSIVDFSTVLDGLLIGTEERSDISYRIRLRGSVLTEKPEENYDFIKKLYDSRSRILHQNISFRGEANDYIRKAKVTLSEIIHEGVYKDKDQLRRILDPIKNKNSGLYDSIVEALKDQGISL